MTTYRRIPREVEAVQWFKNGDHPKDGPADSEGRVVRYFRLAGVGAQKCTGCGYRMHEHGWIDQPEDQIVCPGDWIVTGEYGTYDVYSDTDFHALHEPI